MKSNSEGRKSKIKIVLGNLLVTFIVFIIFLMIIDVVLRTTHLFDAKVSWSIPDRLIGYRFVPGAYYWYKQENDHPISGRFNSHGWRDDEWSIQKPIGTYRIAVLGDSYVEAFQVEPESTFLTLTEIQLSKEFDVDVELMNFGRSGFTQSEELLVLQHGAARFAPDMVILFFFPGNDISDIRRNTADNTQRPFYNLTTNGRLVLDTSFVEMTGFNLRYPFTWLKRRSALVSLIYERYKASQLQRKRRQAIKSANGIGGPYSLCTNQPDVEFLENYELCKTIIGIMADQCRKGRVQFMIVTIPSPAYVTEILEEYRSGDTSFCANFFEKDMQIYAEQVHFEHLELYSFFADFYKNTGRILHSIHWNYEGHKLVAQVLAKRLRSIIASDISAKGAQL